MAKIKWDASGEHVYETGVKNGVLYLQNASGQYPTGVAWNGLSSVSETPSGAEANAIWADDTKYLNIFSKEEFSATVEAYTYPDEFAECDGSAEFAKGAFAGQQARKTFGMAYRTTLGNDTLGEAYGYKLHLLYGCSASPSERSYSTINDSPEAITFSWELNTVPVEVGTGYKPTSIVTIDSTKTDDDKLEALEAILFGVDAPEFSETKTYAVGDYVTHSETIYKCTTAVTTPGTWDSSDWTEAQPGETDARLPLPAEIYTILGAPTVG